MPNRPAPAIVPVVAAVVEEEGRYLVGRRPQSKRHGGLWEFPGGKLEGGESWEAGAARELAEELGLTLRALGPVLFERHDSGSPYRIRFIAAEVVGRPQPLEHSAVAWHTLAQLEQMPLAPSDAAFVRHLQTTASPR